MMRWLVCLFLLVAAPAWATDYYISPTGSNSNSGLSSSAPWLTFAHALNTGMAGTGSTKGCGHTLNLLNGVYGDGTATGKLVLSSKACTAIATLTVKALNSRQARINDSGAGSAIVVVGSSYLVLDGLVANSTDTPAAACAATVSCVGMPVNSASSHHITFKNLLLRNPNKFGNNPVLNLGQDGGVGITNSEIVDVEIYDFHRHGFSVGGGASGGDNFIHRVYCNPRTGAANGGYDPGTVGQSGGSCVAVYTGNQSNIVVANVLSDGVTTAQSMFTVIADVSNSFSNIKVLGSIGLRTQFGGGKYEARTGSLNTGGLIENVAITLGGPFASGGVAGLHVWSTKNLTVRNMTVTRLEDIGGATQTGISQVVTATTADQIYSMSLFNTLMMNLTTGYQASGSGQTRSGSFLNSYNNTTAFSPSTGWGTTLQVNPDLGTCIAYIPDTSPMKMAGAGGADIGANVLYEYNSAGTLTQSGLWNTTTGQWNFLGATVAGINDVAGQSLFDFHVRAKIKQTGCPLPASYTGGAPPDTTPPAAPIGLVLT